MRLRNTRLSPIASAMNSVYTPLMNASYYNAADVANLIQMNFSRVGMATTIGSDGTIQWGPHNHLTESGNFQDSTWIKATGLGITYGQTDNFNTSNAARITSVAGTYRFIYQSITHSAGLNKILSFWVKSGNGTNQSFRLAYGSSGARYTGIITATNVWQQFYVFFTSSSTDLVAVADAANNASAIGFDLLIASPQLETVHGTNRSTPSPYVDTTVKNRIGYSNDFINAVWVKGTVTVYPNSATLPDNSPASLLIPSTVSGLQGIYKAANTTAGGSYVESFVFKYAGQRYIQITCSNGEIAGNPKVNFDILTGTVTVQDTGITGSITSIGNGFYRLSIYFTAAGSVVTCWPLFISTSTSARASNFIGDGLTGAYIAQASLTSGLGTLGNGNEQITTVPITQGNWVANGTGGTLATAGGSAASLYGPYAGVFNVPYRMTIVVASVNGTLRPQVGNVISTSITTPGTYTVDIIPTAGSYWYLEALAGTTAVVTSISIKSYGPPSYFYNFAAAPTPGPVQLPRVEYDTTTITGVFSEYVTTGVFNNVANGTDVTTLAGWYAYGTPTTRSINNGVLTITANAMSQGAQILISGLTVGVAYKVMMDVGGTYASIWLGTAAMNFSVYVGTGQYFVFTAASTSESIYFRANGNTGSGTTTFNNISIKQAFAGNIAGYGTELVVGDNANFNGGTVGSWTNGGNIGALSVVANRLRITNNAGINGRAQLILTLSPGKTYKIHADAVGGTATSYELEIRGGVEKYINISTIPGSLDALFVAVNASTPIELYSIGPSGQYADFDNISVQEVQFASKGILLEEEQRTQLLASTDNLSASPWQYGGVIAMVPSDTGVKYRGRTMWKLTKTNATSSESWLQGVTLSGTGFYTWKVALLAGNANRCTIGLYGNSTAWGALADSTAFIYSGPGICTQTSNGGAFDITKLSTTVPTVVIITRNYTTAEAARVYFYPDTANSTTLGNYIYAQSDNLEAGKTATSFIPNPSATGTVLRAAESAGYYGDNLTNYFPWFRDNNIYSNPEGSVATLGNSILVADTTPSIIGFANSIRFPTTAATCAAYRYAALTNAATYSFQCVVQMDDNSAPVVGANSGTGDFSIMQNNSAFAATSITARGDGSYLITLTFTSNAYTFGGIVRYSTQSGKGFRVTAMKLESGPVAGPYYSVASKQGKMIIEADVTAVNNGNGIAVASIENGANRYALINAANTNNLYGYSNSNSTSMGTLVADTAFQAELSFSQIQNVLTRDNGSNLYLTTSTMSALPNKLVLGSSNGSSPASMHLKTLKLLSNATAFKTQLPVLDAPLMDTLIPRSTNSFTYSNPSLFGTRIVTDYLNNIKYVRANEARFVNRRRVENLLVKSEDFTSSAWSLATGAAAISANTLSLPNFYSVAAQSVSTYAAIGTKVMASVEMSGTGTVTLGACRSTGSTYEYTDKVITLTTTPTRYNVSHTIVNSGQLGFSIYISRGSNGTASVVTATKCQLEYITTDVVQTVSEYVPKGTGGPYYGSELSLSATSTDGWVTTGGTTIAVVNNELIVTNPAGVSFPGIRQTLSAVAGRSYFISITLRRGTSSDWIAANFGALTPTINTSLTASLTNTTLTFVETAPTTGPILLQLFLGNSVSVAGTFIINSISIRECLYSGAGVDGVMYSSNRYVQNLLTNSHDFTNANWARNNCTITSNVTPAPDGTMTGDLFTVTNLSNPNIFNNDFTCSAQAYVGSVYVKAGNISEVFIQLYQNGFGVIKYNTVILSGPGTVINAGTVGGLSATEWTRIAVYTTELARVGSFNLYIKPRQTGTAIGDTLYLWGAQLEQGSVAGTYVSTTNTSLISATATDPIVQYGYELMPSLNSVTSWTAVNCTIVSNDNSLVITNTATNGYAYAAINCIVGQTYYIRLSNNFGLQNNIIVSDASNFATNVLTVVVNSYSNANNTFIATASTMYVSAVVVGGVNGIGVIDNFTCKQLLVPYYGFLEEPQSTNLMTYSQDFTNWGLGAALTVTNNSIIAPDGTLTGNKLLVNTTGAIVVNQAVVNNATYATFSVYIKQGSGPTDGNAFVLRNSTTATNLLNINFNYSTGVITYNAGTTGVTAINAGNGWWRLVMTVTTGVTSGNTLMGYVGYTGGSFTSGMYIYAWGAQFEAMPGASTYIPTTTAAVTRSTDVLSYQVPTLPNNGINISCALNKLVLSPNSIPVNSTISIGGYNTNGYVSVGGYNLNSATIIGSWPNTWDIAAGPGLNSYLNGAFNKASWSFDNDGKTWRSAFNGVTQTPVVATSAKTGSWNNYTVGIGSINGGTEIPTNAITVISNVLILPQALPDASNVTLTT